MIGRRGLGRPGQPVGAAGDGAELPGLLPLPIGAEAAGAMRGAVHEAGRRPGHRRPPGPVAQHPRRLLQGHVRLPRTGGPPAALQPSRSVDGRVWVVVARGVVGGSGMLEWVNWSLWIVHLWIAAPKWKGRPRKVRKKRSNSPGSESNESESSVSTVTSSTRVNHTHTHAFLSYPTSTRHQLDINSTSFHST